MVVLICFLGDNTFLVGFMMIYCSSICLYCFVSLYFMLVMFDLILVMILDYIWLFDFGWLASFASFAWVLSGFGCFGVVLVAFVWF